MSSKKRNADLVKCPYDPHHQMLRKRLQAHIIKCRVNFPDVKLHKCPINQTHLVTEQQFQHHVANCPDLNLIAQYKYEGLCGMNTRHAPIQCEDNWDDTEVSNYNPQEYVKSAGVLRNPVMLQTQRKVFVKEEYDRFYR